MKKLLSIILVLSMLLCLLASCGDDETSSTSANSESSKVEETSTVDETSTIDETSTQPQETSTEPEETSTQPGEVIKPIERVYYDVSYILTKAEIKKEDFGFVADYDRYLEIYNEYSKNDENVSSPLLSEEVFDDNFVIVLYMFSNHVGYKNFNVLSDVTSDKIECSIEAVIYLSDQKVPPYPFDSFNQIDIVIIPRSECSVDPSAITNVVINEIE